MVYKTFTIAIIMTKIHITSNSSSGKASTQEHKT